MKIPNSKFLILSTLAFLSLHCGSDGNYVQPPEWGNSAAPASNYSVSGIANYGIENDGLIHLQIQGDFPDFNDTVVASCAATPNPQVTVLDDSYNAIDFTLSPINDTCTFSVQNSYTQTSNATSATVSTSQMAVTVTYTSNGGADPSLSGFSDITLNGSFHGGGQDQVFAACDGATSFTQSSTASSPVDTSSQIVVAIPTPVNYYSCQFYVTGGGIVGLNYSALGITNAVDASTNSSTGNDTINLSGSFVGPASGLGGDQVWVACDNATAFTQIVSTNIVSDGYQQIQFLMPTPIDSTTCEFYVVGNGYTSSVY